MGSNPILSAHAPHHNGAGLFDARKAGLCLCPEEEEITVAAPWDVWYNLSECEILRVKGAIIMANQVFNPYLPSYEYVPDGEPRVFGNRLYVFGSHDRFNGKAFCMNDYV